MPALCTAAPAAHEPVPAQSSEIHTAQVNLSGRRRFTSQRVVLFAVLASLGHEGAIETARETLAQLRDAHLMLVEGRGPLPGAAPGQLYDAYFGSLQADAAIRAFIDLAQATLDAIATETHDAPRLLRELVSAGTPLLSLLNGLTLMYEEQARRQWQAERAALQRTIEDVRSAAREARRISLEAEISATRAGQGAPGTRTVRRLAALAAEIDDLAAAALAVPR